MFSITDALPPPCRPAVVMALVVPICWLVVDVLLLLIARGRLLCQLHFARRYCAPHGRLRSRQAELCRLCRRNTGCQAELRLLPCQAAVPLLCYRLLCRPVGLVIARSRPSASRVVLLRKEPGLIPADLPFSRSGVAVPSLEPGCQVTHTLSAHRAGRDGAAQAACWCSFLVTVYFFQVVVIVLRSYGLVRYPLLCQASPCHLKSSPPS
jgi:hypothetical protein